MLWKKNRIFLVTDLLIYNKATNLHIAIQIDSPYDKETRRLKNYYDPDFSNEWEEDWYTLDNIYNDYFEDPDDFGPGDDLDYYYPSTRINPLNAFSSWFFVKLSEKQVAMQPNECCKFIMEKIFTVTGEKLSQKNYNKFNNLKEENMWTFEDATKMEAINYRSYFDEILGQVYPELKNYADYEKDYINWYNNNMPKMYDDLPF